MGEDAAETTVMLDVSQLDLPAADRAIVQGFVAAWREHNLPVLFVGSGLSKMAVRKPSAPSGAAFRDWSQLPKSWLTNSPTATAQVTAPVSQSPLASGRLEACERRLSAEKVYPLSV